MLSCIGKKGTGCLEFGILERTQINFFDIFT